MLENKIKKYQPDPGAGCDFRSERSIFGHMAWVCVFFFVCVALAAVPMELKEAYAEEQDGDAKILQFFAYGFDEKDPAIQLDALRQMSMLHMYTAIPFYVSIALDDQKTDDVRREALKSILSLNTQRFKPLLKSMKEKRIGNFDVVNALVEIDRPDFVRPLVETAAKKELSDDYRRKLILAVLNIWRLKDVKEAKVFKIWKGTKAEIFLRDISKEKISQIRSDKAKAALKALEAN